MPLELSDPEDAKLLTLARSVRSRAGAPEAAALRDSDGRTYIAASVNLPSLQLSALQVAVAMAVSSGVKGVEAAVVVSDMLADSRADVDVVRDLGGPDVPVYRADSSGVVHELETT